MKTQKQILSILMAFCLTMATMPAGMVTAWAEPVPDGKYYIKVVVHDTDQAATFNGIDSCNNSEGYLVIPTRKQDGTTGETWSAHVKAGEWDEDGGTWEYRGDAVNGFPINLRKVRTNSPTAQDWITNNNKTYKSIINFKIFVSPDNNKWTEVLSYDEETKNGGNWSYTNGVDSDRYPYLKSITLIGSGTINHNGRKPEVPIDYRDQYGVAWGLKYDDVLFLSVDNQQVIDLNDQEAENFGFFRMDTPESYTKTVIGVLLRNKLESGNYSYHLHIQEQNPLTLTVNFAPDPLVPEQDTSAELGKDECAWYSFTPSESGHYMFYSASDYDTKCEVYAAGNPSVLVYENDNGPKDDLTALGVNASQFFKEVTLKGGTTYYFKVRFSSGDVAGTIPFVLSKYTGKAIQLVKGGEAPNLSAGCNTPDAATVWFGKDPNKNLAAWRVIGYNGDDVASEKGNMTLLAGANAFVRTFRSDYQGNNQYNNSILQNQVNLYEEGLSTKEKAAIVKRTLIGNSENRGENGYNSDHISGDPVIGALFWPLSVAEAEKVNEDLRIVDPMQTDWISNYWWLRTPGDNYNKVAFVGGSGDIVYGGAQVVDLCGVRPAFNLNLDSVLLTSAASTSDGGKTGDNALKPVNDYTGTDWKLTLLDSSREFSVTEKSAEVSPGSTVNLNYTNATVNNDTAPNEYISAILADKDGNLLYYGRLSQPDKADGEVNVTIPDELEYGTYTLKLFSEQYNGDYMTDYASDFSDVELIINTSEKTARKTTPVRSHRSRIQTRKPGIMTESIGRF